MIREPKKLSEEVQDLFQSKLNTVEHSLGEPMGNYLFTLRNMTRGRCRTFKFTEVTKEEVLKQIRKVPNKNSFGNDKISYMILKMLNI